MHKQKRMNHSKRVVLAIRLFLLFVILFLVILPMLTGCTLVNQVNTPDDVKMQLCSPGWPSGWWRPECPGEGGGWDLLEEQWQ